MPTVSKPAARTHANLAALGRVAADRVAQRLAESIEPPQGWARGDLRLTSPGKPSYSQYGSACVLELEDRSVDFQIWLDRTREQDDTPILCAAFGVEGSSHNKALEDIARAEGVRRQPYYYDQVQRSLGFSGLPVLDVPGNAARFLSSYRPAGDFDVEAAVRQFRAFFGEWSPRVALVPSLPRRQRRLDGSMRILCGLVGELVALAGDGMKGAVWVGPRGEDHDIQLGPFRIEVKTRGEAGTATVSLRQLVASRDEDGRYFAMVDLPPEARRALWVQHPKAVRVHQVVRRFKQPIERLLRSHHIEPTAELHVALSQAVRAASGATTFHRAKFPAGFWDAIAALERQASVAELVLSCDESWFEPTVLPVIK
jgi:hypothetical protein